MLARELWSKPSVARYFTQRVVNRELEMDEIPRRQASTTGTAMLRGEQTRAWSVSPGRDNIGRDPLHFAVIHCVKPVKMQFKELVATGRPPTLRVAARALFWRRTARSGCSARSLSPALVSERRQGLRRLTVNSEPNLAERALEIAQDVIDTDMSEVLETVQHSADSAVQTTSEALQETAAAVGVTAANEAFQGLAGPVRAMILLNLGSALFGSNQVAMKITEGTMAPDSISAIRFLLAAAVFLPGILRGLKVPALRNAGIELGAWLFGAYILQALGLETTTAAHGSFTGTIMVLIVPLLVGLSGRKVANITWAASIVALLGVALLTTSDAAPNSGDGLCILSAVLFGVHKWRSETATVRFRENTQELVAMQLGALATFASAIEGPKLIRLAQQSTPEQMWSMASGLPWPLLMYMGFATTAFTLWVEINALKDVSAPLAALIYTSEPLWGALFAWTLLGEHWGATGWVGAFLIVVSSLAAQVSTGDEVPNEERPAVKVEVFETTPE